MTRTINEVSKYWDTRPCNIRHSTKDVGTFEYFNEVESRKYFVEPHIPRFAEFEKWRGKKVLEIGCGIGTDTINFARHGATVTAVDLSKNSIDIAKQRAIVMKVENRITFYNCNAEELISTVPADDYDLIYSFGVIHHTPNPENVIEQIRNHYCHEHTILKIMVYHENSFKGLKLRLNLDNTTEAQLGCPIAYTYDRRSIKELLKSFDIKDITVEHIFPYELEPYIRYEYVKKPLYRYMPKFLFRWLEHRFGWHLCVTATPNKIS